MDGDVEHIEELGRRWAAAEIAGDVAALDQLAADEFVLVGPLGFVLDKAQWLDRYRNADLVTSALAWRDSRVRIFGGCAVVVGVDEQEATYRGQPNNGRFRVTHVAVRDGEEWQLAGMHFSPIAAPPGMTQRPR
jgi:ketosteroid isomerase-like protein